MNEPASPPPPPLPEEAQPKKLEDDLGMRMLLPVGRSGYAIAAGYLGLFGLLIIPAPLALIFGILGIVDIQRSKKRGKQKFGMGRAIFGLVIGILGTGVLLILSFAAVAG